MALIPMTDMVLLIDVTEQAKLQHHFICNEWDGLAQTRDELEAELLSGMSVWAWMEAGEAIGVVKTRCVSDVWVFWHLIIMPQYQSRGLVTAILLELEALAQKFGCMALEGIVHFPRDGIKRWYEILGYQAVQTDAVIQASGYQMVKMLLRKSLLPTEPSQQCDEVGN
ncbi:GNAT family N-acetyltransferase [Vitreoscilla stercoraria]|uniref:GNAT family N-acetyltransferase n=1 Tax=Vitreoscilla stercoraria TaxID=61 RepID=A0ABY4EAV9_VITST|nr:GNAT family N-acetyltransferase [Vitreoscilla stercoraria]UOO92890.1 GNAT family N-acetyltransferase [Vitreoscilla stercoraria]